ncbi:Transcription factor [Penicillium nucicola]|uniref:Transcription factor n=1 Tax=Penicillium nucicola TaxID=1850975 RepID=UPI002545768D|nr:Transcription factor [Penicillium nucicola]KAJ5769741.1 Transcription factor [Penicillium nucicola]
MHARGVIIAKFGAMPRFLDLHALDVDRTVVQTVFVTCPRILLRCHVDAVSADPETREPKGGPSEEISSPPADQNCSAPSRSLPSTESQYESWHRLHHNDPSGYSSVSYEDYEFIDSDQLLVLSSSETMILDRQGCLSLPDPKATDEFVKHYFKRIHPLVPVLDEAEFWRSYLDPSTGRKLSLFVFQAMLFASCPLVGSGILRRCGFNNRRDAREELYNRAKLLFELGTEKTCHATAQGAVLLSHYTSAEHPWAGSLWLTRAIENTLRIDARPSQPEIVGESLKKRLWWSILLRDRSICIGLHRRPQITSSILLGTGLPDQKDFEDEMQNSLVYNYETKQSLLIAFRRQCNLAALLTNLFCLIFDTSQTRKSLLSSIEFQRLMLDIKAIKESLSTWKKSMPFAIPGGLTPEGDDPTATLINLTVMYYHAARVDLAQYEALVIEENLFYAKENYTDWVQEISNDLSVAIAGLTTVVEYFGMNNDAYSLPLSVLVYVSMPLVLAAIDLKLSPSRGEMELRQKRLESISLIIRRSEMLYNVTDFVAVGTNHILQLAYTTTHHLFSGETRSQTPKNMAAITTLSPQHHPNITSQPREPEQPQSWQDTFVRCPRAYLLISTSVDYSLSFGKLPSAHNLPGVVRDLPAMGGITRLPWTLEVCPSIDVTNSMRQIKSLEHLSLGSVSAEMPRVLDSFPLAGEGESLQEQNNHGIWFTTLNRPRHADISQKAYLKQPAQSDHLGTNLDYMELEDLSRYPGAMNKSEFSDIELSSADLQHTGVVGWSKEVQADNYEVNPHPPVGAIGLSVFDAFFYEAFEGTWAW